MWRRWSKQHDPTVGQIVARESPDRLLRRLQWTVLRPLAAQLGGDERSLIRGPGLELSEVREYQPGDDVRHIDWNITARTERPFIREAHVERGLDVWFIVDLSASIDWGTAECLKRDRAIEFVAVAGQLLGKRGNRIGALLFADRPLALVPPGAGRPHLLRMLGALREEARQAQQGCTNLTAALNKATTTIQRKSVVIIISDLLVQDGWQPILRQLAQRHELIVVRLSDPRESELPDVGLLTLEDPETGAQLTIDSHDQGLRDRFRAAAQAQVERIRTELVGCGVDHLPVTTDTPLLTTLVRFLAARRIRRGMRSTPGRRMVTQSRA